ncbi:MAG TPA: hypothetical protein VD788_10255 [Candidatus Polarisedimenticolaceae bacterium]|nr:hypothetical protein [Candidatus Polarisedimenticolaceae bacterium]
MRSPRFVALVVSVVLLGSWTTDGGELRTVTTTGSIPASAERVLRAFVDADDLVRRLGRLRRGTDPARLGRCGRGSGATAAEGRAPHRGYRSGGDWNWMHDTVVEGWRLVLDDMQRWFRLERRE